MYDDKEGVRQILNHNLYASDFTNNQKKIKKFIKKHMKLRIEEFCNSVWFNNLNLSPIDTLEIDYQIDFKFEGKDKKGEYYKVTASKVK